MPDVVGKRSGDARRRRCRTRGFEVDVVPIQSDTVAEDRVAGQRPERAATEADEGSMVTITVSSGPGEAPVPVVQGLPADEAADAAARGRLQVRAAARVLRHGDERAA